MKIRHLPLALLLVACSTASASSPPATPAAETPEPNLCSLDGGRWCFPCGDGASECDPQNDSGWLCCANNVCVEVDTYDECELGVGGWCSDYSTETLRNGVEVAVCEDSGD